LHPEPLPTTTTTTTTMQGKLMTKIISSIDHFLRLIAHFLGASPQTPWFRFADIKNCPVLTRLSIFFSKALVLRKALWPNSFFSRKEAKALVLLRRKSHLLNTRCGLTSASKKLSILREAELCRPGLAPENKLSQF
jgi:hypothetical protein